MRIPNPCRRVESCTIGDDDDDNDDENNNDDPKERTITTYLPTYLPPMYYYRAGNRVGGTITIKNNKSHVPNKINAVQYHYHASPAPGTVVVEGLSS